MTHRVFMDLDIGEERVRVARLHFIRAAQGLTAFQHDRPVGWCWVSMGTTCQRPATTFLPW